jgi:5-methylcytosine-specific restriction protein A
MALNDVTPAEVRKALAEYDELGQDSFLTKYGFGRARTYLLQHGGRDYDSKAILGVAHGFLPGEEPLTSAVFFGGKAAAAGHLRKLGFDVSGPSRNPPWNRDELILALDLYLQNTTTVASKTSPEVSKLSVLLNKMSRLSGQTGDDRYRNENGVYMKMMNFRSLDPEFTSQGKVGMQSGGALEKEIWAEYDGRRADLAADANDIRLTVEAANEAVVEQLPIVQPYEGEEGGIIIRLHKRYERDPRLIAEKKRAAKAAGELHCQVCGFDFEARYGELGADFIEVHHTRPVHSLKAGSKTKLADLATLCSNCHRMAHRRREPLSLTAIKAALR